MNSQNIILSVCCLTYNQECFLTKALDGFLSQKVAFPIEIIIYDDFSKDNTRKLLLEFKDKCQFPVTLLFPLENKFTKGECLYSKTFEKVQGKYIALCDGDDYWIDPLKLQMQVDFLEKNERAVGCFHNSVCVDNKNILINERYFHHQGKFWFNREDSLKVLKSSYSTSSLLFRASAIQDQLEEFIKIRSDFILDILITRDGDLFYMDENMSAYRIHDEGIWQGNTNLHNLKVYLERFLFMYNYKPLRDKYGNYLWKMLMYYYDEVIRFSKTIEEKQTFSKQRFELISFTRWRTYPYFFDKFRTSLRYRWKRLKKNF
jgi:glycosyltransferase involved in cell wall biosynthesis